MKPSVLELDNFVNLEVRVSLRLYVGSLSLAYSTSSYCEEYVECEPMYACGGVVTLRLRQDASQFGSCLQSLRTFVGRKQC